ncbi:MAG: hypothetical protein COU66_01890 [Candidatus Pacebacteria bacterium CG10_big_fil_rev_8_21_14_0_10_44_11]|nr:MAG: hypothetical protein COU66_01890 [Candidatus Pacebacteria bacterium CG10_big_fil_rev_8_21_14_0_10_44_11]
MLSKFFLIIKYPYTAGVIAIIWLGSSILMFTHPQLPIVGMVTINIIVCSVIGLIGFRVVREKG